AVAPQRVVNERAERVVAGAGDHGRAPPVPRRRDGDVGRAAAEPFAEGLDVLEPHAHLQRVQVSADPAHRQDLERAHVRPPRDGAAARVDAGRLPASLTRIGAPPLEVPSAVRRAGRVTVFLRLRYLPVKSMSGHTYVTI